MSVAKALTLLQLTRWKKILEEQSFQKCLYYLFAMYCCEELKELPIDSVDLYY